MERKKVKDIPEQETAKCTMCAKILKNDGICTSCKNKSKAFEPADCCANIGCHFKTNDKLLLEKHQQWTCPYDDYTCHMCDTNCKGTGWLNHCTKKHGTRIPCKQTPDSAVVTCQDLDYGLWNSFSFDAFGTLFHLVYRFDSQIICIKLTSCIDEFAGHYYRAKYDIKFVGVKPPLSGALHAMHRDSLGTYDDVCDWRNYIYINDTALAEKEIPEKCVLKITIKVIKF